MALFRRGGGDDLDAARSEDGSIYVDRDAIDFDPDEGHLSGTAVDGTTEIPGPHADEPGTGPDGAGGRPDPAPGT